jgi:hypothetical protein
MVRMLQALGVVALVCAGIVLVFCVAQWLDAASQAEGNYGPSVVERFKQAGNGDEKGSQKTVSPLVQQAEAFASYLNPPKPPLQVKETPTARSSSRRSVSVVELPQTTPKFTLLATSYYRARPGESLALVSEPGSEPRWVAQGAPLGHFVVEEVKRGLIVYRDGDRLGEMAVDTKAPVQAEQAVQTTLASGETGTPPSKPSSPGELETRPRQPMRKLGPPRQEIHVVAYDHTTASG